MVIGVIPARYAASRLPGKPLVKILGKPLIQWVAEGAAKAKTLDKLIVATDHDEVAQVVQDAGFEAVLTDSDLPSGSDRVWAAAKNTDAQVIVNIQGDEPLISGKLVDQVVEPLLAHVDLKMSTAASQLSAEDLGSKDVVKVVVDQNSDSIYFSRFSIPFSRGDVDLASGVCLRHLGIYGYRRDFLAQFCRHGQTVLERAESLEQLRAHYLGVSLRVVPTEETTFGVDTPEDVKVVEEILKQKDLKRG